MSEGITEIRQKKYVVCSLRSAVCVMCLLVIAGISCAEPDNPNRIFYKANDLYEEGKFDDAITEYEKLIDEGYESGNLYYNLGNSYFKIGELGKAVLNYERAKRLIPRDGDLESNYRHARSLIEGNVYAPPEMWLLRFIYNMFDQFTINELTILLSIMYMFIILTLAAAIFTKSKRQVAIIASILALIFVSGSLSLNKDIGLNDKEAIIIADSAEAKFEPFNRATTHFTLYEGMKVRVILQKDEWQKVERRDGKAGWIESAALDAI